MRDAFQKAVEDVFLKNVNIKHDLKHQIKSYTLLFLTNRHMINHSFVALFKGKPETGQTHTYICLHIYIYNIYLYIHALL